MNLRWTSYVASKPYKGRSKTQNGGWRMLTEPLQNADFQSIFARSMSAVTPSEKNFN